MGEPDLMSFRKRSPWFAENWKWYWRWSFYLYFV